MKRLFGLIVCVALAGTVSANEADSVVCRISGTVINRPECKEVAILESGKDPRISGIFVIPVKDSKFSYTLRGDVPRAYSLFFPDDMRRGGYREHPFITGNGDVEITCHDRAHEESDRMVSNIPDNMLKNRFEGIFREKLGEKYDELRAKSDSLFECKAAYSPEFLSLLEQKKVLGPGATLDSISELISIYSKGPKEKRFSTEYLDCLSQMYDVFSQRDSICRRIISEYPSVFGLDMIKLALMSKQPTTDVDDYIRIFDSEYRYAMAGHPYVDEISLMIDAHKVEVGNRYPDYKITRPDGTTEMILSLIDGNVAVIDLWASWCGPCRRHSIELIPLYEKYKDKGFKVVAVAREKGDCDRMVKAMKNDGYPWESFVDLDDADNVWRRNRANNSGGKIILVGADGIIVGVDSPIDEIKAYLEKIYGEKSVNDR